MILTTCLQTHSLVTWRFSEVSSSTAESVFCQFLHFRYIALLVSDRHLLYQLLFRQFLDYTRYTLLSYVIIHGASILGHVLISAMAQQTRTTYRSIALESINLLRRFKEKIIYWSRQRQIRKNGRFSTLTCKYMFEIQYHLLVVQRKCKGPNKKKTSRDHSPVPMFKIKKWNRSHRLAINTKSSIVDGFWVSSVHGSLRVTKLPQSIKLSSGNPSYLLYHWTFSYVITMWR